MQNIVSKLRTILPPHPLDKDYKGKAHSTVFLISWPLDIAQPN